MARHSPIWRRSYAPIPPPKPGSFVADGSYGLQHRTVRRIFRWPRNATVTAIPLAVGAGALVRRASVARQMRRAQVGRGALLPSARLEVRAMAPRHPPRYPCPATRWSLAARVAALAQARTWTRSRARLWRLLAAADRKPHRR